MTDTKPEGPYEAEALGEQYAVFGPTVPERDQKDSQFYVGGISKCVALSNALNFAYAAGRASRDRLREALDGIIKHQQIIAGEGMSFKSAVALIAREALAEDEKEGK